MTSDACKKQVQSEQARLAAVGTTGTPAFFINGRFLSGAQPLPAFKQLIDEELKKAEAAIASGAPAGSFYKSVIVEKGLKKM